MAVDSYWGIASRCLLPFDGANDSTRHCLMSSAINIRVHGGASQTKHGAGAGRDARPACCLDGQITTIFRVTPGVLAGL
jgi:hypothetical protein